MSGSFSGSPLGIATIEKVDWPAFQRCGRAAARVEDRLSAIVVSYALSCSDMLHEPTKSMLMTQQMLM